MKRYWLTVSLLLLAISGPIIYYGFGQNNQLPEIKLETVDGDENEALGVTLQGYYRNNVPYALTVDEQGSEYSFEKQSSLQQLQGGRYWLLQQPDLRRLVQEHRSFMRGKTAPNGFYADEQMVAYADVTAVYEKENKRTQLKFDIEILDKETDQQVTYKQVLDLTEENNDILVDTVRFVNVDDVQLINNELLIMLNIWAEGSSKAVYALSESDGTITLRSKLGEQQPASENAVMQTQLHFTDTISEPSTIALLETSEDPNMNGRQYDQKVLDQWDYNRKLMFYNYSTNDLTDLPQELVKLRAYGRGVDSLQDGLYYYGQSDAGILKLSRYAVEEQQLDMNYVILTKEQLEADEFIKVKISGEHVYLLLRSKGFYEIAVFALTDGKPIYRGKAVQSGKNAVTEEAFNLQFELYDISLSNKSL